MTRPEYYSQYGEDRKLAELFLGKIDGTCAEVGGHDGVSGSNTFYFERLGWTCVLVEPIPWMFEAIQRNRRCFAFQGAASDGDGELELMVGRGQEQLASFESAQRTKSSGAALERIKVRTRRLDDILADAGMTQLDFISIDVEGHEYSVLEGFTLEKYQPRVLVIEASLDRRVERHLNDHGYYRFAVTGANDWYARSDDPAADLTRVAELRLEREHQWRSLGWRPKLSLTAKSVLPRRLVRWLQRMRNRLR